MLYLTIPSSGLPHSEILGSQVVTTLPRLIAGSHVLHRLLVPRHPSYALSNFTKKSFIATDSIISASKQKILDFRNVKEQIICGVKRTRTASLLNANQMLYQLSYNPAHLIRVGLSGVEPLTSRLSGVRSNQLSYRPVVSFRVKYVTKVEG